MLSGDEAALIAAAVAGRSLAEIASEAGVSVSTVQRRLRDRNVKAAVREGRADQQRQRVGQLNTDAPRAINRLWELVDHEDPRIAMGAADRFLNHVHRFNQALATAPEEEPNDEEATS